MLKAILKRIAPGRVMVLLVIGIFLAAAFVGVGFLQSGRPSSSQARTDSDSGTAAWEVSVTDSRKVAGFVEAYGRRINETRKTLAEREEEFKKLSERQAKNDQVLKALLAEFLRLKKTRERDTTKARDPRSPLGEDPSRQDALPSATRIQRITLLVISSFMEGVIPIPFS